MKKQVFIILLFLFSNVSASDVGFNYNEDANNNGDVILSYDDTAIVRIGEKQNSESNFSDESDFVAAGGAMGVVHLIFWGPISLFVLAGSVIIYFYYNKFQSKDRGVWKTVFASFVALIVAGLLWNVSVNFADIIASGEGCGKLIAKAYLGDGVNKSIAPSSYTFGTKIIETGCFE